MMCDCFGAVLARIGSITFRLALGQAKDANKSGYLSENIIACVYSILLNLVAPLGLIEGFT